MNRFRNRVAKVYERNFQYFSREELDLMLRYAKADLDRRDIDPADFEEEYKVFSDELIRKSQNVEKNPYDIQVYAKSRQDLCAIYLYQISAELREHGEEGVWLENETANSFKKHITAIKEYFKRRDQT